MSASENPYLVPRDLLEKYNTAGPRYTSYPTAPEWSEGFGEAEALAAIAENQQLRPDKGLSLYVHVPFCHKLCYYCGCNMIVTKRQDFILGYLDAIVKEIANLAAHLDTKRREVVQIHWGGGTPTFLEPDQISLIADAIRANFTIAPDAEISMEVHPAVTTVAHVERMAQLGFNRISMGIQDFAPAVQQAVNRIQPFEVTRDLILLARKLGFVSVNVDLMYGLPYQTVEGFSETLALVEQLGADRIALFNYAHMPWLKPHQGLIQENTLPSADQKLAIFELAISELMRQGYRYIGMDHFALPDNELSVAQADRSLRRNFMGYTTCADSDLYSFGVTSISDLDTAYFQNSRKVPEYLDTMKTADLPVVRGMKLSLDDRLRREVINRLICHCHLDKQEISTLYGIDFDTYFAAELPQLAPLAEDGLVEVHADHLKVTARGQMLLRNICMVFDAYLGKQSPGERKFSRTV